MKNTLGWVIDRYFTPIYSSVGNNFTFDVVEDSGSNLSLNVSFTETLARTSPKSYPPASPGIETKPVGQRTAVYGTDAPTIRGRGTVVRIAPG